MGVPHSDATGRETPQKPMVAKDPKELEEQIAACDDLDRDVRTAIVALKSNQAALLEDWHKLKDQLELLRAKHRDSSKPLEKQRAALLKQQGQPVAAAADEDEDEEATEPVVGIPGFWLRALNSQPDVASAITARDSSCLEALQDIQIEHKKGSVTFKFHFGPNEFFSNKVLSKSLPSMEGCNIKWSSPESNLTRKEVAEKKSKAKKGKKAKEEQKEPKSSSKSTNSFFHFFSTVDQNSQHQQVQTQIAVDIIQEVVPNCVPLFVSPYESVDELLAETDDELAEVWKQPEVQQRISEIWQLHAKFSEGEEAVSEEMGSLQMQYQSRIEPLCAARSEQLTRNAPPRFWQQAFLSAGVTMSAADEKVMAHVADVSVTNGKVEFVFTPDNPLVASTSVSRSCNKSGEVSKSGIEFVGKSPLYKRGNSATKSMFWAFQDGNSDEEDDAELMSVIAQQIVPFALSLYIQNPDALEFIAEDEDDDESEEDDDDDDEDDDEGDDTASRAAKGRKNAKKKKGENAGTVGGLNMMHFFTFIILSSMIMQFLQ